MIDDLMPLMKCDEKREWLWDIASGCIDDRILRVLDKLPDDVQDEICYEIYNNLWELDEAFTLEWAGDASGLIKVLGFEGFYFITSTDYDDEGPFGSLEEVLNHDYLCVTTSSPSISSETLSKNQLMQLAQQVVDWDNEGDIYINGEKYEDVGDELQLAESNNQDD